MKIQLQQVGMHSLPHVRDKRLLCTHKAGAGLPSFLLSVLLSFLPLPKIKQRHKMSQLPTVCSVCRVFTGMLAGQGMSGER